jgi:transcription antitermination factor NusG
VSFAPYPWYVIAVRARREAHISGILEQMGYEPYLPSYVAVKKYSDRVKKIEQPLFPGYLFIRLDIRYRLPILKLTDVIRFLGDERGPTPVVEAEIEAVSKSMASNLAWQPWPFLETGNEVTLITGPLCGVEGKLVSLRGDSRLVIGISLLQRAIAIEVDRTWVRPRDSARFGPAGQPQSSSRAVAARITHY